MRYGALALLALMACGGNNTPSGVVVDDLELTAFLDDDGDGRVANDPPQTVRLSRWFAASRPGTRIIMLNAAAGWCGPCMREASAMDELHAAYGPRGVAVLTAVFQDTHGDPADDAFARAWAETFELEIPTLVDTAFATSKYFDVNTMPANMFVDAETAEILTIAAGAEPGDDPLSEYRALLDHYLQ